MLKALCSDNESSFKSEIDKAENHCHRAIYDAHEVGILFCLKKIKDFKENYGSSLTIVREVVPTYVEILIHADRAREFIDGVKHDSINARNEYYNKSEPYYSQLKQVVLLLDASEPAIQAKIQEEDKKERESLRRFLLQLAVTIMGIIATTTIGYITVSKGI